MNPDVKVLVLEKSSKLLSKVRISGGGRCNCTHACFDTGELSRHYPRGEKFVRKAFHQFNPTDTIKWFAERGVSLKTESDGRMFPVTDRSETIMECLLKEVSRYRVEIRMNADVVGVEAEDKAEAEAEAEVEVEAEVEAEYKDKIEDKREGKGMFRVKLAGGELLRADYLLVATGGYPRENMFDWLTACGHNIEKPVPSLFTFNMPGHPLTSLMGVSVPQVTIRINETKQEQTGPVLITHWGLSGPAVLKLSAYAARELAARQYKFSVRMNWLPGENEQSIAAKCRQFRQELAARKMGTRSPLGLPSRLWIYLLREAGIHEEKRWADLPVKEQNRLISLLAGSVFDIRGKTTFKEEFVTAGGIRLNEIDVHTMQSKKVPGLYFAGEVTDVDGITGGFNFQYAWTSSYIAASSIAAS